MIALCYLGVAVGYRPQNMGLCGMDSMIRFLGLATSLLVGVCGFLLIVLFAATYLTVLEWVLGPVDDPRTVLAGGLVLGFAAVLKGLDVFVRWYERRF